eukprot:UN14783
MIIEYIVVCASGQLLRYRDTEVISDLKLQSLPSSVHVAENDSICGILVKDTFSLYKNNFQNMIAIQKHITHQTYYDIP